MLSVKNKHGVRIACCIKNNITVSFVYAQDDINDHDIIEGQGNLTKYLDMSVFNNMRSPNKMQIIAVICSAIDKGVSLNPRNASPIVYQYYATALQDIYPKLKSQLIAEPHARFMVCPTMRSEQRDYLKISAPSGAGKSTVASNFAETWHYTYPNFPIYLICAKEKDKCYDALPYIQRIPKDDWLKFLCKNEDDNDNNNNIYNIHDDEEEEEEEEEEQEEEEEVIEEKKIRKESNDDDDDDISCEADGEPNRHGDEQEECPFSNDIQDMIYRHLPPLPQKKRVLALPPPPPKKSKNTAETLTTKVRLPLKKYIEKQVQEKTKKRQEKKKEIEFKEIAFFKDCLFIFDDIDKISPEKLRKAINDFKDYVMQLGRSENVNLILCDHMLTKYQKTREDLNECTAVVIFPRTNTKQIRRYLGDDYLGFDKEQLEEILSDKNRWVMVYTQHPQVAVTEKKVWILKKTKQ
jgi:hypothetical protein